MFSDIENHWSKKCILALAQKNLVSGYPDRTFHPNAPLTRAEFAVLMGNIFHYAQPIQNPISFKDVTNNHWAYKDIQNASTKGFLAGYPDKTFQPEQLISRVQAFIALAAQLKLKVPENSEEILTNYFDDAAEIPQYAREMMAAATNGFIVVNYPNSRRLKPNKGATRGEMMACLCQVLGIANVVQQKYLAKGKLFAIAPQFDYAKPFSKGFAQVIIGDKEYVIDKRGNLVDQFYTEPQVANNSNLQPSLVGEKIGYVDNKNKFIIPPEFDEAREFSEGLAAVRIGAEWVIEPRGNDGSGSPAEYVRVLTGGKWGYIFNPLP
ncbi:S-layer homology domain-containing protein [Kamptonema animale CS-326]|jgi:hypothetical protein|uniref:S-layer homology domain-containing protein n=1 Tax=Kamptonema animale TaxID=92934 RepID=UPI002330EEE5|nr:S-layer homology domain-containing protein [Kamptonema animale]MDB9511972.1 S-layer homology domain-containing protein [Kamptonema animale CS-326]